MKSFSPSRARSCSPACVPSSRSTRTCSPRSGVEADLLHIGDVQGHAEPYTRDSLSEPVRKNMTALIDDLYDEMLTTIAADRDLKVEEVRKLVDRGLLMAGEAQGSRA